MRLSEEQIRFIEAHKDDDVGKLALLYGGKGRKGDCALDGEELRFALMQIEARQRLREKLPTILEKREFVFPTRISTEQASSEVTAALKGELVLGILSYHSTFALTGRTYIDGASPRAIPWAMDRLPLQGASIEGGEREDERGVRGDGEELGGDEQEVRGDERRVREDTRGFGEDTRGFGGDERELRGDELGVRGDTRRFRGDARPCVSTGVCKYVLRDDNGLITADNDGLISVDLTGGLGVDSIFMGRRSKRHHYVEVCAEHSAAAEVNLPLFLDNVVVHNTDAESFLRETDEMFDFVYADPARRSESNSKVFRLEECVPNILELKPLILSKSRWLIVKLSPMLDITQAVEKLGAERVIVVSVNDECKELIVVCGGTEGKRCRIEAVEINKRGRWEFGVWTEDEGQRTKDEGLRTGDVRGLGGDARPCVSTEYCEGLYGVPEVGMLLYEPYAAMMKVGHYEELAVRYGMKMVAPSSHLYFCSSEKYCLPGRYVDGIGSEGVAPGYSDTAFQADRDEENADRRDGVDQAGGDEGDTNGRDGAYQAGGDEENADGRDGVDQAGGDEGDADRRDGAYRGGRNAVLAGSIEWNSGFPGRGFVVREVSVFTKKSIKEIRKANITVRNFPMSVAEVRKRFGIADGGEDYVFLTMDCRGEKLIIRCEKVF